MEVRKDDLAHAIIRFRNELGELGVPSSKRLHYMEQFKNRYAMSYDYDLAMSMTLDDFFGKVNNRTKFKTQWNIENHPRTQKGFMSWFNNQRNLVEVERIRSYIKDNLKQGGSPSQIHQVLTNLSIEQLGRPLNSNEYDKLEMIILEEKVKLQDTGYRIR